MQQTVAAKAKLADERLYRSSDLAMDSSIPDNRRSVLSIAISPLGTLAALVDSFGRVLLLDCENFTIRRMWKGAITQHVNNVACTAVHYKELHVPMWYHGGVS